MCRPVAIIIIVFGTAGVWAARNESEMNKAGQAAMCWTQPRLGHWSPHVCWVLQAYPGTTHHSLLQQAVVDWTGLELLEFRRVVAHPDPPRCTLLPSICASLPAMTLGQL